MSTPAKPSTATPAKTPGTAKSDAACTGCKSSCKTLKVLSIIVAIALFAAIIFLVVKEKISVKQAGIFSTVILGIIIGIVALKPFCKSKGKAKTE
jgi:hypothetical protein